MCVYRSLNDQVWSRNQLTLIPIIIGDASRCFFFPFWYVQEGDLELVKNLLEQHRGIVDLKCDITGDTPLIAAARAGHSEVRLPSLSQCWVPRS